MAAEYAFLALGSVIMFGLIGIVAGLLAQFVKTDSKDYDERFIWQRKIQE